MIALNIGEECLDFKIAYRKVIIRVQKVYHNG